MNFFDLPAKTMTLTAILLGFLMIDDLTAEQQNSLGNFFKLIGQILETNAAQAQQLQESQKTNTMENRIHNLEKELTNLKNKL